MKELLKIKELLKLKELILKIIIILSLAIPVLGETSQCLDTSICGNSVSVDVTLTFNNNKH